MGPFGPSAWGEDILGGYDPPLSISYGGLIEGPLDALLESLSPQTQTQTQPQPQSAPPALLYSFSKGLEDPRCALPWSLQPY